jgi:hypothetical protein
LKVKSRNSVFPYKGKDVDVQKVGNELTVDALLTGRVVQRGDTIQVSADLTNVQDIFDISNAEEKKLQFSFATKLAHTVDPTHPLYDIDITKYFRFQSPSKSSPDFDARVQPLMDFYGNLSACYGQVLADGALTGAMQFFRDTYSACIPDIKILDCIFKSAGSRGLKVTLPTPVGGVEATQ